MGSFTPSHSQWWGKIARSVFPWICILCLLEVGATFSFFLVLSSLSKFTDDSGVPVPVVSLSTCGCILSAHLDLCLSSVFKCSPVRYFSMGVFPLILTFSLVSEISYSWKPILQVKTKSRKAFSILASVSAFLLPPGHLSLFSPLLHFIFMSEFCQDSFPHLWSCKSHDKFTWLYCSSVQTWAWTRWNRISALLDSSLQGYLLWDPSKKIQEQHKICFSKIVAQDPAFLPILQGKGSSGRTSSSSPGCLQQTLTISLILLILTHRLSWLITCAKAKLNTTTPLSHLEGDSYFQSQSILPKNSQSIQNNLEWEKAHNVSCSSLWSKQSQLQGQNGLLKSFSTPVLKTSTEGAYTNSWRTYSAVQQSSWWKILISNLKNKIYSFSNI